MSVCCLKADGYGLFGSGKNKKIAEIFPPAIECKRLRDLR